MSWAVRRTILTNLLWAFGYNSIGLALAVSGHLQPVMAEALAWQPARLCAITEVEHGSRLERAARRADHSPLTVAYDDPLLCAAGLRGDTIGDAAEFFGLSHAQLHHLVCSCHHGLTMDPQATAAQVRGLTQHADACTAAIITLAAVGAPVAALTAAVAVAGAFF